MGCVQGKQRISVKTSAGAKDGNSNPQEHEKFYLPDKGFRDTECIANLEKSNCDKNENILFKDRSEKRNLKVKKNFSLLKKLTVEVGKIEGFEKSMNSERKNISRGSVKIGTGTNNVSLIFNNCEEEKEKEKDTSVHLNLTYQKPERKFLGDEFIKNNSSFITVTNQSQRQNNFSIRQCITDDQFNKSNLITGLNILPPDEEKVQIANPEESIDSQDKLENNSFEAPISNLGNNRRKSCLTAITGGDGTNDNSCIEEDKHTSMSPCKIIQKFNINPYHNLEVVKKYFIYQLKKSFLQAKKFVINNALHSEIQAKNNKNMNYHEIFTNYSQISNSTVFNYVKYEDQSIEINNYAISKNKLLGRGGFSTVYKCRHLKDNKEYAVKITDKNVRANAKKTKYDYVKDEVNILKRLHSRYVVKTYDIIETKNECLIFMELMVNNSLASRIVKLDDFKVWKYFRNLICGLEHCHEIGKIVHRDINVNNLLISGDDILKLSDFGVSIVIDDNDDLLPINLGPTTYTPPEVKSNENTHYSGKMADIWCCGLTLFHMVYKYPLFQSNGAVHPNYKVELPVDVNEAVDPDLKDLLIGLLDENPEERYTFKDIRKHPWITKNGEFPLPDIHEEALEYVFSLTTEEIEGIREY